MDFIKKQKVILSLIGYNNKKFLVRIIYSTLAMVISLFLVTWATGFEIVMFKSNSIIIGAFILSLPIFTNIDFKRTLNIKLFDIVFLHVVLTVIVALFFIIFNAFLTYFYTPVSNNYYLSTIASLLTVYFPCLLAYFQSTWIYKVLTYILSLILFLSFTILMAYTDKILSFNSMEHLFAFIGLFSCILLLIFIYSELLFKKGSVIRE